MLLSVKNTYSWMEKMVISISETMEKLNKFGASVCEGFATQLAMQTPVGVIEVYRDNVGGWLKITKGDRVLYSTEPRNLVMPIMQGGD